MALGENVVSGGDLDALGTMGTPRVSEPEGRPVVIEKEQLPTAASAGRRIAAGKAILVIPTGLALAEDQQEPLAVAERAGRAAAKRAIDRVLS
jgi:hypothetical protein